MSHKKQDQKDETQILQEEAVEVISKSEEFLHNNRKILGFSILGIVIIIAGFLSYRNLYLTPRVEKAGVALYKAEHYFDMDSFQLALNGNGADIEGFLEVIKNYGNTKSGNLAQAYAGISYYHLGQPEQALDHLKKYKGDDIMLAPTVKGLMGDCYVDLGRSEEAIKYFEEAAKVANNDLLSPIYLLKAGIAYEAVGKSEEALKAYNTIKEKYYSSPASMEADKYIQAINLKK